MTSRCGFFAVLLALATLPGCLRGFVPRAAVDLREVHVVGVQMRARTAHQTICPGEIVPLDVAIDAVLPGDHAPTRLHLRREDLDDWIFEPRGIRFTSRQGTVDEQVAFHASADPLASASSGFLVDLATPGPSFGLRFRPSYDCIASLGRSGVAGDDGRDGEVGPATLSENVPMPGQTGGSGAPGSDGPTFRVYVSWVRSSYYPKLLAAVADRGFDGIALAAPEHALTLNARGGKGGAGGRGGPGAKGEFDCESNGRKGKDHACLPTIDLRPGNGGTGGAGGRGGHGGTIEVHIDARYPDLAKSLAYDVRGGAGGEGGRGGEPGGSHVSPAYAYDQEQSAATGTPGSRGQDGAVGEDGVVRVLFDDVDAAFTRVAGVERL